MENQMIGSLIISHEGKAVSVRAPAEISARSLISWAVKEFDLPAEDEQGFKIKYIMILRRTGSIFQDDETLETYGVQEHDEIKLEKEMQIMNNSYPPSEIVPAESKREELQERDAVQVIEKLGDKVVDAFNKSSERKDKIASEVIGIDKNILLVFSIALLGSLFFSFYLIAVDKTTSVTNFLYPVISLVLGFMSGYFAGTGRTKGK